MDHMIKMILMYESGEAIGEALKPYIEEELKRTGEEDTTINWLKYGLLKLPTAIYDSITSLFKKEEE